MPRIKDIYSIPAGLRAYPHANIRSDAYNNLIDDLIADNNSPRPILAGGTGAASVSQARVNLGIDNASNIIKGIIRESCLPFPPVQQGGGIGQLHNKIYLGWNNRKLLLQVDQSPKGEIWTSQLAPPALLALVNASSSVDKIFYTQGEDTYATTTLTHFMRRLLSCQDLEALQAAIFKPDICFYDGFRKIFEFSSDGEIYCRGQGKVWQGIEALRSDNRQVFAKNPES